jgi:hypothetical protein
MNHDPKWIERTLRGDAGPGELQQPEPEAALRQLRSHGVGGLILAALRVRTAMPDWTAQLRAEQRAIAIWELRHQSVMAHAITNLAAAGCQPIVLKGTALAYWLYADPSLRPRGDTDILVHQESRQAAESALTRLGFVRRFGIEGKVVSHQATYSLESADGSVHALDLHWRANNSPVLAPLFSHEELWRHSEPLAPLGKEARRTDASRSLLLACVHRAVHEANPYFVDGKVVSGLSRLVWLYDIRLLCEALTPQAWAELPATCQAKGLARIVSDALQDAAQRLGARIPEEIQRSLESSCEDEPAHRYVYGDKFTQRWMDWNALGWAERLILMKEVALPSAIYMRTRYADNEAWLPRLYARRIARGWRAQSPVVQRLENGTHE